MNAHRFAPCGLRLATLAVCALLMSAGHARAATVSFLVDPSTLPDTNNDTFVNGTDFSPIGTDGTVFTMEPGNNLVGITRFLLSDTNGLRYGGGGGSTLWFSFSTDRDIQLRSYTLTTVPLFLGNPVFDIEDPIGTISSNNTSNAAGDTHAFDSGPLNIDAGTVYTFRATTTGAAIQAFMESWDYTATGPPPVVPTPAAVWAGLGLLAGVGALRTARRR